MSTTAALPLFSIQNVAQPLKPLQHSSRSHKPVNPLYSVFKMVEAGGVEPPSEKRNGTKPTCLSQFGVRSSLAAFRAFARRAQNEQETQPASPMNLARVLRTERLGPAHCVTPLTGPMSKARGSVRLIN